MYILPVFKCSLLWTDNCGFRQIFFICPNSATVNVHHNGVGQVDV